MTLQETIINELGVKPTIDPKEEIRPLHQLSQRLPQKASFFKNLCFRNLGWPRFNLGRSLELS